MDSNSLLNAGRYANLEKEIPEDRIAEWNKNYNLSFPAGIRFIDVLWMIQNNQLPRANIKREVKK